MASAEVLADVRRALLARGWDQRAVFADLKGRHANRHILEAVRALGAERAPLGAERAERAERAGRAGRAEHGGGETSARGGSCPSASAGPAGDAPAMAQGGQPLEEGGSDASEPESLARLRRELSRPHGSGPLDESLSIRGLNPLM